MKFFDLDGNPIDVNINNKLLYKKKTHFSGLHKKARALLNKLYPTLCIYEDVPVRVLPDKLLFIDLFLVEINLAVEVHGKQHYEYCSFFHKNKLDFLKRHQDDIFKKEWCKNNMITYVELPYNESIEQWEKRLNVC